MTPRSESPFYSHTFTWRNLARAQLPFHSIFSICLPRFCHWFSLLINQQDQITEELHSTDQETNSEGEREILKLRRKFYKLFSTLECPSRVAEYSWSLEYNSYGVSLLFNVWHRNEQVEISLNRYFAYRKTKIRFIAKIVPRLTDRGLGLYEIQRFKWINSLRERRSGRCAFYRAISSWNGTTDICHDPLNIHTYTVCTCIHRLLLTRGSLIGKEAWDIARNIVIVAVSTTGRCLGGEEGRRGNDMHRKSGLPKRKHRMYVFLCLITSRKRRSSYNENRKENPLRSLASLRFLKSVVDSDVAWIAIPSYVEGFFLSTNKIWLEMNDNGLRWKNCILGGKRPL